MPIDFYFKSIDRKNIDEVMKSIAPYDRGYPNWGPWQEKARSEFHSGIKYGYALYNYGSIAGDMMFQKHKEVEKVTEIKNFIIHPGIRRRKCGTLMLKQIEFEMPWEAIICDARVTQTDAISLMISQGYFPIAQTFLYDSHNQDIVLIKLKNQSDKERIIYRVKSVLNLGETPKTLIYPWQEQV